MAADMATTADITVAVTPTLAEAATATQEEADTPTLVAAEEASMAAVVEVPTVVAAAMVVDTAKPLHSASSNGCSSEQPLLF
jgi:hypothetical protein